MLNCVKGLNEGVGSALTTDELLYNYIRELVKMVYTMIIKKRQNFAIQLFIL